jgi:hypothetical protein
MTGAFFPKPWWFSTRSSLCRLPLWLPVVVAGHEPHLGLPGSTFPMLTSDSAKERAGTRLARLLAEEPANLLEVAGRSLE